METARKSGNFNLPSHTGQSEHESTVIKCHDVVLREASCRHDISPEIHVMAFLNNIYVGPAKQVRLAIPVSSSLQPKPDLSVSKVGIEPSGSVYRPSEIVSSGMIYTATDRKLSRRLLKTPLLGRVRWADAPLLAVS